MSQITFTEFLSSFCIILSQINLKQNLNRASTGAQWGHPYLKKEINLNFLKIALKPL